MKEYEGFDTPEEGAKVDAQNASFELAALFGKPVLFSKLRIVPDTLPADLFAYELGQSDVDANLPVSLQKHISANFFGTIVSDARIELTQTRYSCGNYDERYYQPVEAGDFHMDDFASLTKEQIKKYIDKFSAIELYVGMKRNPPHEPRHKTDYVR